MAKAELELIKMVLQRNDLDIRQVSQIMEDLQHELDAQVEEKPPPVKKQFTILVSDSSGELSGKDLVGWVLQIPEDDDPRVGQERLIQAAYEYNTTPKGQRIPVKTIGEVCEVVTARITKEHNVWIKTIRKYLIISLHNSHNCQSTIRKMTEVS